MDSGIVKPTIFLQLSFMFSLLIWYYILVCIFRKILRCVYHVHLLLVEPGEEEDEVLADVQLDHGGVARVLVEHPDRSVRGLELVDPQEAEEELERI